MYLHSLPLFLVLYLCCIVNALSERQGDAIQWVSCRQNGSVPVACGTLKVPLDYSDPSSKETLTLELVKLSAVKQPKKGSILFNPGGPGDSGRDLIVGSSADALLVATGGSYDLIGFDTRYVSSPSSLSSSSLSNWEHPSHACFHVHNDYPEEWDMKHMILTMG